MPEDLRLQVDLVERSVYYRGWGGSSTTALYNPQILTRLWQKYNAARNLTVICPIRPLLFQNTLNLRLARAPRAQRRNNTNARSSRSPCLAPCPSRCRDYLCLNPNFLRS